MVLENVNDLISSRLLSLLVLSNCFVLKIIQKYQLFRINLNSILFLVYISVIDKSTCNANSLSLKVKMAAHVVAGYDSLFYIISGNHSGSCSGEQSKNEILASTSLADYELKIYLKFEPDGHRYCLTLYKVAIRRETLFIAPQSNVQTYENCLAILLHTYI